MTTTLDGIADWSLDDRLISFDRDGVIHKMMLMAPLYSPHRGKLPRKAYDLGFRAGVFRGEEATNPYVRNGQKLAWKEGHHDGLRVRRIVNHPGEVFDLQNREYKLLPPSLQALVRDTVIVPPERNYAREQERGR